MGKAAVMGEGGRVNHGWKGGKRTEEGENFKTEGIDYLSNFNRKAKEN